MMERQQYMYERVIKQNRFWENLFLSTTEFTILSRTIGLQGWVSDVVCPLFFFVHDGITFERFKLEGWNFEWGLIMKIYSIMNG